MEFKFIWKIENFNFVACSEEYTRLVSPTFTAKTLDDTNWKILLYPPGEVVTEGSEATPIPCFLQRCEEDDGAESITVDFEFSILSVEGLPCFPFKRNNHTFLKEDVYGFEYAWSRSLLSRRRRHYLPDNALIIVCHLWRCFPPELMFNQCSAITRVDVERSSFKISLNNSSQCFKKKTFSVPLSTAFEIVFHASEETSEDFINIEIKKSGEENSKRCKLVCKLSLLNESAVLENSHEDEHIFPANTEDAIWQFPFFIKIQRFKEEGFLSLHCEFSLLTGECTSEIEATKYVPPCNITEDISTADTLIQDMEWFYSEKTLTDVKLQSGKEVLPAHKAILSARSPVFRTMFENDMVESQRGIVDITDISSHTLSSLLYFMYTGKTEDLQLDSYKELLFAADKYQVLSLKRKCASYFKSIIASENACEILILGDMHQEESLKVTAQEFICSHYYEILNSDKWKDFLIMHTKLASETLHKLSMKCLKP